MIIHVSAKCYLSLFCSFRTFLNTKLGFSGWLYFVADNFAGISLSITGCCSVTQDCPPLYRDWHRKRRDPQHPWGNIMLGNDISVAHVMEVSHETCSSPRLRTKPGTESPFSRCQNGNKLPVGPGHGLELTLLWPCLESWWAAKWNLW